MQKSVQQDGKAATKPKTLDAIAVLTNDHANVRKLFKQYEAEKKTASVEDKTALAAVICAALTAHTTAEEEIFYPALRDALEDEDLVDEAEVEHTSAKELIAQIAGVDADHPLFDARIKVLSEYVEHHVKEEEGELFAKARKSKLDLEALGAEIDLRKEEVLAEILADE
jgi:hemerythrin superfamily protein